MYVELDCVQGLMCMGLNNNYAERKMFSAEGLF